ncbi:MAG: serine/threonine protein kinase [Planctomycetes bacterium]|nr:serine/threonine protein kinase [Planctomycetota bacterium]
MAEPPPKPASETAPAQSGSPTRPLPQTQGENEVVKTAASEPGGTLLELNIGGELGHQSVFSEGGALATPEGETLIDIGNLPTQAADTPPGGKRTTDTSARVSAAGAARYELHEELGRGGMGVVVRAFDRDLGRDVALKISRVDRSQSHGAHLRFVSEAQVTGQLSHPNIVPVHEIGADPKGRPYFTMKLVEGKSLSKIIKALRSGDAAVREAWPLSRRLYIFGQLLNGMAYAHARGVIHRDLKPDNIMLGEYGEVLVMDWGLGRVIGRPEACDVAGDGQRGGVNTSLLQTPGSETLDGSVLGTPAYMPPEQARGERDKVDQRSDIYCLGAILYELLALQPPYTANTASELIAKAATERPQSPSKANPGLFIPRGIEAMCMKCLAHSQADRYQSVKELQADLDRYIQDMARGAEEGLGFAMLGKIVTLCAAAGSFIFTAWLISGQPNPETGAPSRRISLAEHLFDPGMFSGLMTLGLGTLAAWVRLGPRRAFDATHAVLLWKGSRDDELRGLFAAEACRRAKWCYLLPSMGAIIVACILRSIDTALIAVQMLGGGVFAALAINLVEQGTYRRLDAMDEVPGQEKRDWPWRVGLTFAVMGLGVLAMALARWNLPSWVFFGNRSGSLQGSLRQGALITHLLAVLAGVWVLAQISHPFHEVNRAFVSFFKRNLSAKRRDELAPFARQFAADSILFGAIGSITWIGLHAPTIGDQGGASASHFVLGLTPMLAGLIWNWFFRFRGRSLNILKPAESNLRRRYEAYIASPRPPKSGFGFYLAAWVPFIVAALVSIVYLVGRAMWLWA